MDKSLLEAVIAREMQVAEVILAAWQREVDWIRGRSISIMTIGQAFEATGIDPYFYSQGLISRGNDAMGPHQNGSQ